MYFEYTTNIYAYPGSLQDSAPSEMSPNKFYEQEENINEDIFPSCPTCGSDNTNKLGVLGKLAHYKCRNCGMEFSEKETPDIDHKVESTIPNDTALFAKIKRSGWFPVEYS